MFVFCSGHNDNPPPPPGTRSNEPIMSAGLKPAPAMSKELLDVTEKWEKEDLVDAWRSMFDGKTIEEVRVQLVQEGWNFPTTMALAYKMWNIHCYDRTKKMMTICWEVCDVYCTMLSEAQNPEHAAKGELVFNLIHKEELWEWDFGRRYAAYLGRIVEEQM